MARGLGLATLVCALALGACGGFAVEEVPSDPIAFMRQEAAKGLSGLDEFRGAIRIPNPADPATLRPRRTTTLSLLHVPTGDIEAVPGATPGLLPLDWSRDGLKLLLGRWDRGLGAFRLSTWTRLTGAYDEVSSDFSAGAAALGRGPIRLALVGSVRLPDGRIDRGVQVWVEGAGLVPLPGGTPGSDPDVSSDGRSVIFIRPSGQLNRDGAMLLVRLGEPEPRALGRGGFARFSRDGSWITFVRRREGQFDVWLMRSNGTGKRAITNSSYDEESPAVSPDGRYVVYASVRPPGNESQLYLARISDGREIQLTQSGQNGRPVW